MRAAKKGETATAAPKAGSRARRKLSKASALDSGAVPTDETGLAVVVVRREENGTLALVAALAQGDRLTGRVYAAAARGI